MKTKGIRVGIEGGLYLQGPKGKIKKWSQSELVWKCNSLAKRHFFQLRLATDLELERWYNPAPLPRLERFLNWFKQ